jgi:hypothetical protein
MEQIICHLIGDYLLQNNWMALNKTKSLLPAVCHCLAYTLPFAMITQDPLKLFAIFFGHLIVDHSGIVKELSDYQLKGCEDYQKWILGIVRDNTVHLAFNYIVLLEALK